MEPNNDSKNATAQLDILANDFANASPTETWTAIVTRALIGLGKNAKLHDLYGVIERHPKTNGREHWQAKVRQVLQRSGAFVRVEPSRWSFASLYSAAELVAFAAAKAKAPKSETKR